jgi:hypothetical protein
MDSLEVKMTKTPKQELGLVLLHLGDGLRQVVDPMSRSALKKLREAFETGQLLD